MGAWRREIAKPIELSESEWEAFEMIGGATWLRNRLRKMKENGIAIRNRNSRIRRDKAQGMGDTELGQKYNLDRTTIWRIVT